ncbi:PP2C family protein-serine/threonine phosphatase [Ornithinibacillus salinisoli]|uniref:PP2C family protein-serine/threonine phosphatase n=1 Tax=Ornithinibacillus salinisoli TaxID=1848459 RepID=A0ABW4W5R3_9BACI
MNKNWHTGIASHQGTKKAKNEDSYLTKMTKDSVGNEIALFVVADGMGGYQVGDTASRLAIEAVEQWWEKRIDRIVKKKNAIAQFMKEADKVFSQINKTIITTSNHTGKRMGTTLTLLILYMGEYGIIHIGDSRVYLMNGLNQGLEQYFQQLPKDMLYHQQTEILEIEPELFQLTEDHSWVEKQVLEGKLSKEEARNHPKRNVLLQCLGIEKEISPYITVGKYQSNDMFLLCSDGFYSLFSNKEIKHMLLNLEKEYGNLQAICDYLINFSNFSNAHDNITLMLVRHLFVENTRSKKSISWLPILRND